MERRMKFDPRMRKCLDSIFVVSALCADVEPQARHYIKLEHSLEWMQWNGCSLTLE
jgi:hypothetical protein